MKIRKMVIEDYEKVYQLWVSCAGMGLNNLDDSKEGIEKFLKRNPDTCFVAEDHEIIGVILAGNDGRRGYIYHTAVHPDYRKQGIAANLVEYVEKAMAGIEVLLITTSDLDISLLVHAENEDAAYEALKKAYEL